MPNLRIAPKNHLLEATLTSSNDPSADTGFALTNLQNFVRDELWSDSDTDPVTLTYSWGDGHDRTIDVVSIHHHEMHGATVTIEAFSDAAATVSIESYGPMPLNWWTPDSGGFDWGVENGRVVGNDPLLTSAPFRFWLPEPVTCRALSLTFDEFTLAYGATSWLASVIFAGNRFEVARNPSVGVPLGVGTIGDRGRALGGSLRASQTGRYPTVTYDFEKILDSEFSFWRDLFDVNGVSRPMLTSLYPEEGTRFERAYTILGPLTSVDALGRQIERFTGRLQIEGI